MFFILMLILVTLVLGILIGYGTAPRRPSMNEIIERNRNYDKLADE